MAAGEIYMKTSGTNFYWRSSTDVERTCTAASQTTSGGTGDRGGIYVNGIYFCWRLGTGYAGRRSGTTTGGSGTAGAVWISGNDLYYNDSTGATRRIVG